MDQGASAVDEVISRMDEYFLTREDWDTIVELGLDQYKDSVVLKKISTATKTSFTKKYNSRDHPIAFHKAESLGKVPKKIAAAGPVPDLEEAFDFDDDVDVVDESEDKNGSNNDADHDSLIKATKQKGKASTQKSAMAKGKSRANAKKG
ncbi:hypothetical protein A0H81_14619 [Grifola frondosa]|uniref:DNA replication factor RFC1 C-terminal domain-containing protein n=1 Tax=Grifola frondosa TaxID=5627 RepID=A0A1C7LRS3_GRIFR|nr:hypothetical protein A0H81_14619 [Grifola frondosa]